VWGGRLARVSQPLLRWKLSVPLCSLIKGGRAQAIRCFMKPRPLIFLVILFTLLSHWVCLSFGLTGEAAARPVASSSAPAMFLPARFAGWQVSDSPISRTDPEAADSTHASLLREYGFSEVENATYTRDDGRKLTIKAARFQDASGAYGAFTFYRTPEMQNEKIGDEGSSLGQRILFYRGNTLVDAIFDRLSAMSAAELRELGTLLPLPRGSNANLPVLPAYLPKDSYLKNTTRYVMGPVALESVGAPLSPQYVDFNKGAEVALGDYNISGRGAKLMLISYPTPQIATSQARQIESAQQQNKLDGEIVLRRTGPILVLASGTISAGDARSLVSSVNYEADVTWNEKAPTRRDNAANLIVGVILLAAIVCGISVVAGVAFGGFRIAIKRFFPDKVFDRPDQMEIIALHLSDPPSRPNDSA
jgi:hypothetical protein